MLAASLPSRRSESSGWSADWYWVPRTLSIEVRVSVAPEPSKLSLAPKPRKTLWAALPVKLSALLVPVYSR